MSKNIIFVVMYYRHKLLDRIYLVDDPEDSKPLITNSIAVHKPGTISSLQPISLGEIIFSSNFLLGLPNDRISRRFFIKFSLLFNSIKVIRV
jgi:hypothetical protein